MMFAARGFERTTIRAVSAEADVDASMVMRYFQSKAGLFTAAISTDLQVPERAALIAAQLLGLALCRYILRFEALAALPADAVVAAVGPSVQEYLTRASFAR
jgi:AcrR family transcriptional regulator